MTASGTPCDSSCTVSCSGHRVASIRRRSSVSSASGTSTEKGRMSTAPSRVLAMENLLVSCSTLTAPPATSPPWKSLVLPAHPLARREGPPLRSAEREAEGGHPGVEELDLERPIADRRGLPEQL